VTSVRPVDSLAPPLVGAGRGRPSPAHTGLALAVIMTGVLITAVDTTIVVLALPEIQRSIHVGIAQVIWVIIGYLLVITLLATQVGRLGDMFGRVRMYEAGFAVFIVGSLLCALSWDQASIIAFRVLQGVGGALITANSNAVIADTIPAERRGRAYGYVAGLGWNLGAVIGVVLGGAIVTYMSWRWIFWINVPIGGAALALAARVLHDRGARQQKRLDISGMVTLGLGLLGLLWAITELASTPLDGRTIAALAAGVGLLVVFALIERSKAEPMVHLSLFRLPTMTGSLLAAMFQSLASFAVLFLVIMYLQGVRGLSPLDASLLLVPGYLVGGVVGPLGGRLSDRAGPVLPATLGLAVQVAALAVYAQLGVETGLWVVVAAAVLNGIGGGGFYPANMAAIMKAAPPQVFGMASGMMRMFANVGMVFSFSLAILVASQSIPRHTAFAIFVGTVTLEGHVGSAFTAGLHAAFYASMGLMVLAALLSATRSLLGPRRRAPAASGPGWG
jgi:EmrB/QacA subfamily drug resistance transporter